MRAWLAIAGLLFAAVAVFLFFWDPQPDEGFADDWVEVGRAAASVVSGFVGVALLVAYVLV